MSGFFVPSDFCSSDKCIQSRHFLTQQPRGISVSGRGLRVICGSFYGDSIPMPPPGHPDHPVGAEVQFDITAETIYIV